MKHLLGVPLEQLRSTCSFALASLQHGADINTASPLLCATLLLANTFRKSHGEAHNEAIADLILLIEGSMLVGDTALARYAYQVMVEALAAEPFPSSKDTLSVFEYIEEKCTERGFAEELAHASLCHVQYMEQIGQASGNLQAADLLFDASRIIAATGNAPEALRICERAMTMVTDALATSTDVHERSKITTKLIHAKKTCAGLAMTANELVQAACYASDAYHLIEQNDSSDMIGLSECASIAGAALQATEHKDAALGWLNLAYTVRLQTYGADHETTIIARKTMNKLRKALNMELIPGPKMPSDGAAQSSVASIAEAFPLSGSIAALAISARTTSANTETAAAVATETQSTASDATLDFMGVQRAMSAYRSFNRGKGGGFGGDDGGFDDTTLDDNYMDDTFDDFVMDDVDDAYESFGPAFGDMNGFTGGSNGAGGFGSNGAGAFNSMDNGGYSGSSGPMGAMSYDNSNGGDGGMGHQYSHGPMQANASYYGAMEWDAMNGSNGMTHGWGPMASNTTSYAANSAMMMDYNSNAYLYGTSLGELPVHPTHSAYTYTQPHNEALLSEQDIDFAGGINAFVATGPQASQYTNPATATETSQPGAQTQTAGVQEIDRSLVQILEGEELEFEYAQQETAATASEALFQKPLVQRKVIQAPSPSSTTTDSARTPGFRRSVRFTETDDSFGMLAPTTSATTANSTVSTATAAQRNEKKDEFEDEVSPAKFQYTDKGGDSERAMYAPQLGVSRHNSRRRVPQASESGSATEAVREMTGQLQKLLFAHEHDASTMDEMVEIATKLKMALNAGQGKLGPQATLAAEAMLYTVEKLQSSNAYSLNAGSATGLDAKLQHGLTKTVPNADGRRMKAVTLTGEELIALAAKRAFALGVLARAGKERKLQRMRTRCFAAGVLVNLQRRAQERRIGCKLYTLSVALWPHRMLVFRCKLVKLALLRFLMYCPRLRLMRSAAAQLRTISIMRKIYAIRQAKIQTLKLFTVGAFVTLLRTKGNPVGFKYGQKPVNTGPKVKQIHWDTVTDIKDSLWAKQVDRKITLRALFPDLREIFLEKPVEKKKAAGADVAAEESKQTKPKAIEFMASIDSKRAYNMSISLSKFKRYEGGFEALKEAVIAVDFDALGGLESIDTLLQWVPTPTEVERAKLEVTQLQQREAAGESVPELGYIEKFVYEVGQVANFQQRLSCMRLKLTLENAISAEERNVSLLTGACEEILNNQRLVQFLVGVVRPLGNELNRGTRKAGAQGVKISGLIKLSQTKTAIPNVTCLEYMVTQLATENKELLLLGGDFPKVREAQRLQLQNFDKAFSDIRGQINELKGFVELSRKAKDEAALESFEAFTARMIADFSALEDSYRIAKEKLQKACRYLVEDPDSSPDVFFGSWWAFIKEFQAAVDQYYARKAKKEQAAKQEAALKAKAAAKSTPKKAAVEAEPAPAVVSPSPAPEPSKPPAEEPIARNPPPEAPKPDPPAEDVPNVASPEPVRTSVKLSTPDNRDSAHHVPKPPLVRMSSLDRS